MTPPLNRRDFMAHATAAATAALAAGTASTASAASGRDRTALPKGPTDKVTLGKTGIQVSLVGMGTGSIGSGQASNQTRLGIKGFAQGRPPRPGPRRLLLRRRRPVRLARLPPRGPQGRPPRELRDPDQDPRHQLRRRQEPPRTLSPRAGRRLHRHRAPALHAEVRLAARPYRVDGLSPQGQGGEDHPGPRHELPRHGPAPHLGQGIRSSRSTWPGSTPKG